MTPDLPFVDHELRVRFAETDAQGIVYYANYLVWFEVARMEWMRALGITWKEMEASGFQLVVAHAELDYHASARYDDRVRLRTWVERVGQKSLTLAYAIHRLPDEARLVTGNTVLVSIPRVGGGTVPLPPLLREPALACQRARAATIAG